MMKTTLSAAAGAILLSISAAPLAAADTDLELAFMPATTSVTLLNEGGKYVAIDLKHIPQGGSCRVDKDAVIMRVGPDSNGMTRVRFAAPQLSSGGCPFLTEFNMPSGDYASARATFVQKKDDASRKVEDLKKQLGDKWDELTGAKK